MKGFDLRRNHWLLAVATVVTLVSARPALAVIEAKIPVSKVFETSAGVALGRIEKADKATGNVVIQVGEAISGQHFPTAVRVKIAIPEVAAAVNVGDTVVYMPSRANKLKSLFHIADTWLLGDRAPADLPNPIPLYAVGQVKADFRQSFPSTTPSLIRAFRELRKDGKVSILDQVDPTLFPKGLSEIGKLPGEKPTAIAAGDFDGDRKPDLAVATATGVVVYTIAGDRLEPSKAAPPKAITGKLTAAEGKSPVLDTVAGDFGQEGERSAIIVRGKSITREPIDKESKLPVDDFLRMTGDYAKTFFASFEKEGLLSAIATDIDYNGDGRRDVLIITEEIAVMLPNRGYGAFFVIPKVKDLLAKDGKYPFPIDPGTKLAAADLDGDKKEELIIVTADGRVYVAK